VENGSRSGTRKVVQAFEHTLNTQYLYTPHGNKSHALNYALQEVSNGLICFTDDDVRFKPSILVSYAEAAKQEGRGAFFGGPTGVDYEEPPPEWVVPYLPGSAQGWGEDGLEEEDFQWFLGFNWAAFRTDIVRAGGFDPHFGPGSPTGATGQETNMQRRLVSGGSKKIFVPDAKVWHYVPKSRYTARWVIKRSYRQGCEAGMYLDREDVTMLGVPGLLRETIKSLVKIAKKYIYKEDPDLLSICTKLCDQAGAIVGYWSKKISKSNKKYVE
jgi:glycosyltransferase involved in cell wall biosynthesis